MWLRSPQSEEEIQRPQTDRLTIIWRFSGGGGEGGEVWEIAPSHWRGRKGGEPHDKLGNGMRATVVSSVISSVCLLLVILLQWFNCNFKARHVTLSWASYSWCINEGRIPMLRFSQVRTTPLQFEHELHDLAHITMITVRGTVVGGAR